MDGEENSRSTNPRGRHLSVRIAKGPSPLRSCFGDAKMRARLFLQQQNKYTYTTRRPPPYTSTCTKRYIHTLLRGLQQFRHITTAVGVQVPIRRKCRQYHVLRYIGAAQTIFAVHRRTDHGKRQMRQGCVFSRERQGDIGYGVLITAVGMLNTNNFRSSEQHLLRCSVLRRFLHGSVGWARETPFVWRPALFANDVDGPPPVYVEMICFGDSRVKLGRQEGTNFRDGISDRMSMVSDMRW